MRSAPSADVARGRGEMCEHAKRENRNAAHNRLRFADSEHVEANSMRPLTAFDQICPNNTTRVNPRAEATIWKTK